MHASRVTELTACWSCRGAGVRRIRIFPQCITRPCFDHVTHFQFKRCRWCRGSRRADIITISARYILRTLA